MILKVLKYFVIVAFIGAGSFFVASYQKITENSKIQKITENSKINPVKKYKNKAKSINYTINIKGGKLDIKARSTSIDNLNEIILSDVVATFTKKSKKVKIHSNKVILHINEKIAYLKEGVDLLSLSDDINIKTNEATLDWENNSIYSNSNISGKRGQLKFLAKGFSIKENGEISLKHAKIIKKDKRTKK